MHDKARFQKTVKMIVLFITLTVLVLLTGIILYIWKRDKDKKRRKNLFARPVQIGTANNELSKSWNPVGIQYSSPVKEDVKIYLDYDLNSPIEESRYQDNSMIIPDSLPRPISSSYIDFEGFTTRIDIGVILS